jgi:chemotaxis protein CheZ
VQRKVFRVEQMFTGKRAAQPVAEPRHDVDALKALHALAERRGGSADDGAEDLKQELARIQETIARNKRDLAALMNDGKERRMARAAGELGAAVEGMEKGAEKILRSAEVVDESAKALAAVLKTDYERGLAQDIQEHVVHIYEACNFQDLAGQRIGKVIAALNGIEDELTAMLGRCNGTDSAAKPVAAAKKPSGDGLLNGPRLDGEPGHVNQGDIDKLFG